MNLAYLAPADTDEGDLFGDLEVFELVLYGVKHIVGELENESPGFDGRSRERPDKCFSFQGNHYSTETGCSHINCGPKYEALECIEHEDCRSEDMIAESDDAVLC